MLTVIDRQHHAADLHTSPRALSHNRHLAKPELSAIRSQCTINDHPLKAANFSVIDKCNRLDISVLESLNIHRTKSHLSNYQAAEKLQIVVYVTFLLYGKYFIHEVFLEFLFYKFLD